VVICGLSAATAAASCKEIKDDYPAATDATYWIDGGGMDPVQVRCEMDLHGGGWTVFTPCDALNVWSGRLVAVEAAGTEGIDGSCRPYTRDGANRHTYHYTFTFPPGFTQILLRDYAMRANAPSGNLSDLGFSQTSWAVGYGNTWGDVSFGSGDAAGPVDSFHRRLGQQQSQIGTFSWPAAVGPLTVARTTRFRLGWGEEGGESEGWYPWWSGEVLLR
jgi:hypothetical protein